MVIRIAHIPEVVFRQKNPAGGGGHADHSAGFRGEADFLLLYTTQPIYDRLLAKGILIRNCENFRGLGEGYYRIAVKKQEENEVLLRELAMGD